MSHCSKHIECEFSHCDTEYRRMAAIAEAFVEGFLLVRRHPGHGYSTYYKGFQIGPCESSEALIRQVAKYMDDQCLENFE